MSRFRASCVRWVGLIAAGAALFQTASCADTSNFLTSTSSLVTAGGVLYIVFRIVND